MLILRLRQAEVALTDGRLEEAARILSEPAARNHRQGQELLTRLAHALVARGRLHLEAGRLLEAMTDARRCVELAGKLPDAAALEADVTRELSNQERRRKLQDNVITAARRHVEGGRLQLAEQALAAADLDSTRVGALREHMEDLRARADEALARVEHAIQRGDWPAAVKAVTEAQRYAGGDSRVAEATGKLVQSAAADINQAIEQGALDRASLLMAALEPIAAEQMPLQEARKRIEQMRGSAACISAGDFRGAALLLQSLLRVMPSARWAPEAIEALERAAASCEQVRSGPLGLLVGAGTPAREAGVAPGARVSAAATEMAQETIILDATPHATTPAPSRFLLQVDGVGSFFVLRQPSVLIGPISSSRPPDVPLIADPALSPVRIQRQDDDYFLTAESPVTINGQRMTRKLLANGDRIRLSPRCGLRFTIPNAASPSAVIELEGVRLPQGDVRRVILMHGSLVIGAGGAAHVRAGQLASPIVLHVRGEQLLCRATAGVAGGPGMAPAAPLALGVPIAFGDVRITVSAA